MKLLIDKLKLTLATVLLLSLTHYVSAQSGSTNSGVLSTSSGSNNGFSIVGEILETSQPARFRLYGLGSGTYYSFVTLGKYSSANPHVTTDDWLMGHGNSLTSAGSASMDGDLAFIYGADIRASISHEGNMAIGDQIPSQRLEVYDGNISIRRANNNDASSLLYTNGGGYYAWRLYNEGTSSGDAFIISGGNPNASFTSLTERMRIESDGKVGIGTSSPDSKLHIAGSLKIVDGTQANNYVLTSDADGLASWKPATVNTDDQTLSLTGTQLSIEDGNTVNLSSIDTDTDDQTLSLSGTQLTIVDGNTVDLSSIDTDTDTDDQTLSLTGTQLTIVDGNTVDLSSIDTDTDDQNLTLTGNSLSIEDGNNVDLSSLTLNQIADADNDTKVEVEESMDEDIIRFDVAGTEYFVMQAGRLEVENTGGSIYIGADAGSSDDLSSARNNTGVGELALNSTTTGIYNSAIGHGALQNNTTGGNNAGSGYRALNYNTTGIDNTGVGSSALGINTTGDYNTAVGRGSLSTNVTGDKNTAIGYFANVGSGDLTNATAIGANATVSQSNSLVLGNNADVGIGTSTPDEKLHVVGSVKIVDGNQANDYVLTSDANGVASWQAAQGDDLGNHTATQNIETDGNWISNDGDNEGIFVHSDGDVQIGVLESGGVDADYKLSVDGKIVSKSAVVQTSSWADHVFDKEYELMPLQDVQEFITKHKHLPNVPSESEVLENGINLGDMDARLLEKVEELTLYMIDLKQENDLLRSELESFKKEVLTTTDNK